MMSMQLTPRWIINVDIYYPKIKNICMLSALLASEQMNVAVCLVDFSQCVCSNAWLSVPALNQFNLWP